MIAASVPVITPSAAELVRDAIESLYRIDGAFRTGGGTPAPMTLAVTGDVALPGCAIMGESDPTECLLSFDRFLLTPLSRTKMSVRMEIMEITPRMTMRAMAHGGKKVSLCDD